ncbi:MAG: hypothetical protein P4L27_01275 [Ignavibacteriaceae bacterium]|nr:hypothetical protein [Ignavibacteriaceae bacterium]
MIPDDDDFHYKSIINLLKYMSKVSAPPNFESDLMRRINSGNFKEKYKVQWWDKILLPSRVIPSAAVAASVVAILYFYNPNSTEYENPFLVKPVMREDISRVSTNRNLSTVPHEFAEASVNNSLKINKEGLNFLQIRINDAERAKINKLKEQIKAYFNKTQ